MRNLSALAWRVAACCAFAGASGFGANLLRNGGFEESDGAWLAYGKGFEIDATAAHSGTRSLRCTNTVEGDVSGANQLVEVNQTTPMPLVMRGWSKAEGVTEKQSPRYSIWCDVEYTTDSRPGRVDMPGQIASFQTGTHDWEFVEWVIAPAAPIASLTFHVLFRRGPTGTVWFDDLSVGPLSDGPLTGGAADFPALSPGSVPEGFGEWTAALADNELLVHVEQLKTQPYHADPLRFWVGGKLVQEGAVGRLSSARHKLPMEFPRHYVAAPAAPPYTGVWLRSVWGEFAVDVETRGKQGGAYRYAIAMPRGASISCIEVDGWEPSFDSVSAGRLGDRIVLLVLTETESGADRIRFRIPGASGPRQAAPPTRAEGVARHTLRTTDGLELDLTADGWLEEVRIGGRGVTADRIAETSRDPLCVGAGFYVGDFFGAPLRLASGAVRRTKTGARQTAELSDMGIVLDAIYTVGEDRIDIEAELADTLGFDRAVDLVFKLPVGGADWLWWEDLTHSRPVTPERPVRNHGYPWATVTSPDGATGLTLAVPPHRPCAFELSYEPEGRLLYIRAPLGLSPDGKRPGRTSVAFALFRTDGKWGFRDAARRYYAAFPDAFRRIEDSEGGWLFACGAGRLKNPEDYAYREGGPGGWELDEKLGLLTCPYRIPTQRQIVFPSLPETDKEAAEWIERLARTPHPRQWRLSGAMVDTEVSDGEGCSLRCETAETGARASAFQAVALEQKSAKPIVIGGRCRAAGVTGEPDKDFGLYADVFLASGKRLFGQCVRFNTGTHDWESGQIEVDAGGRVHTVRLYPLLRKGHAGRAWFDNLFVREVGSEANFVRNPGFEETGPHPYAEMMVNCAAHDADGLPYIVRRDNVGADVLPKNPIYNVVYSVNCDPNLFSDREEALTVGRFELAAIESMLANQPKLDGVYLDSVAGWISRRRNYRREHFRYVDHPLSYDPGTGRLLVPGWLHAYDFMAELQRRIGPKGKVVFPNLGARRPFFYFVCDVIGLEGGLRGGDYGQRMNFFRTMAGRKPVLVMDYLEVIGRPTRHADRAGFERFWKWCLLFGAHPSIGRSCVEAYERFGEVYARFREPLKKLGAADWQPVTHAAAGSGVRIERFSAPERRLYFVLFNPTEEPKRARLDIDAAALGLPDGWTAVELLSGASLSARPIELELGPEDAAVVAVSPAARE